MTMTISHSLLAALNDNRSELVKTIAERPDWSRAADAFDAFFKSLADPADPLWSSENFSIFQKTYLDARESDKGMSNITLRTLARLPEGMKDTAKQMFLQTAHVCGIFNASHKVNFEAGELPSSFEAVVPMSPGKAKGQYTYSLPLPALYKKTSLTFDYWVPKIMEWTGEIRSKNLLDWRGEAILSHESCTDFMRTCLLFLSDPEEQPPVAKAEDREAMLANWFGSEFRWLKKSAKREDIMGNNQRLVEGFRALEAATGISIPLEAWSRVQGLDFIKPLIK
jgi:hypothetical protein